MANLKCQIILNGINLDAVALVYTVAGFGDLQKMMMHR